jgi:hypothetical protein
MLLDICIRYVTAQSRSGNSAVPRLFAGRDNLPIDIYGAFVLNLRRYGITDDSGM